ncbi:flavin monoamine oxidase family protein [Blastococcus sp. SYSU D00695]
MVSPARRRHASSSPPAGRSCCSRPATGWGGRTWTRQFGEHTVEMGGTWVHWNQPHVWAELTRYGIAVRADDVDFDTYHLGDPVRAVPAAEVGSALADALTRLVDGYEDALPQPYAPRTDPEALRRADSVTMAERMGEIDLSSDLDGELGGFLYTIAGTDLTEAGLLGTLRWMALAGWDLSRYAANNVFRPVGGTRAVLDALTSDPRLVVRTSTPVRRVVDDGAGVAVTTAGGETLHARAAVLAVPVNVLPTIEFRPGLPAAHLDAARRGMGKPRQDKVYLHVRGELGLVSGMLPAGMPLNMFRTYRRLGPDEQLLVAFNASPDVDVTDPEQVEAVVRGHLPGITEVLATCGHSWSASDPYALGGNTGPAVGVVSDHLEALQQPHGRLVFAGADIANGWFGFIDGAIESGLRAGRLTGDVLTGSGSPA